VPDGAVRRAVYGAAMTDSDTPWEPPLAGTETEHLVGHADLLGEAVDGLVGKDPPAGWHA
jgi:hypothetical protein